MPSSYEVRIRSFRRRIQNSSMATASKRAILEFDRENSATGKTVGTRWIYLWCLGGLGLFLGGKKLHDVQKNDLLRFFERMDPKYSISYVSIYKRCIKRFYK